MAAFHGREMLSMENGLSDSSEEVSEERRRFITLRRAIPFLGGTVAVVVVLALAKLGSNHGAARSDMSGLVQKSDWQNSGVFNPVGMPASEQASQASKPTENLNDGNSCQDDEEEFMSLCYKKCSIITQGTHPYRTSAFTCCKADSKDECGLTNQEVNTKICGGFDVAGNINGQESACPHSFGTCYENEELYLGQCYKKCSILTNNQYPNRVTPFSCCSGTGFACNPFGLGENVKSSTSYNVGGKDTTSSNVAAHYPEKSITEGSSDASASS